MKSRRLIANKWIPGSKNPKMVSYLHLTKYGKARTLLLRRKQT